MSGFKIPSNWTFEASEVAHEFDRHVREQLPWYDLVTGAIAHIARHYVTEGGLVYDVGASTGNIGRALKPIILSRHATFIPIEQSREMAKRYDDGISQPVIEDATEFEFQPFDFAVCYLVLMFVPIEKRADLIRNLEKNIKPGGALVIFDKVEPVSGYASTVLYRLALAGKVAAEVPPGDIVAKELSLAGVQRPLPRSPSFAPYAVEWFRFGDFVGWIIEGSRLNPEPC